MIIPWNQTIQLRIPVLLISMDADRSRVRQKLFDSMAENLNFLSLIMRLFNIPFIYMLNYIFLYTIILYNIYTFYIIVNTFFEKDYRYLE